MMNRPVLITAMVAMAAAAAVPLVMNSTSNVTGYVPEAYAFWITSDTSRFRMNVSLMTADLPQAVFDDPAFQQSIGAHDGVFDVKVWHIRDGRAQHVGTISMPTAPNIRVAHRVGSLWRNGDVIAYEYNPGMHVKAGRDGEPGLPFASLIDNVSNDPVSVPSVQRIDFEYEIEVH